MLTSGKVLCFLLIKNGRFLGKNVKDFTTSVINCDSWLMVANRPKACLLCPKNQVRLEEAEEPEPSLGTSLTSWKIPVPHQGGGCTPAIDRRLRLGAAALAPPLRRVDWAAGAARLATCLRPTWRDFTVVRRGAAERQERNLVAALERSSLNFYDDRHKVENAICR
ncbi:hypothetical protein Y032_0083g1632 [Ancylostoma ceylanicum]|uniref:Uncharacterized protein n=1 Tax=Ancylostoma ceylanicum TaxID=53326 RepID=A0A016TR06_9BILA|nr:hypothetical protein Y032_0083g1632 [Ancylostoma ceylanicum]